MAEYDFSIFADGGSRGNPGPAALGVVLEGSGIEKKEYGEYIGVTTNNIAEYQAVIFGLKKLKQLIGTDRAGDSTVMVNADSELLVRQALGEYKVKESSLQDLFMELWNLRLDFKKVLFRHVPREQNTAADRMVNHALDREENRLL